MKIIIDAFGGDNAPLEIIKGAIDAQNEFGIDIIFTGRQDVIKSVANDNKIDISKAQIVDAPDVITMEEHGADIMKTKTQSSMAVGLQLLADGKGDGFLTAGNSGAVCVGASLIVKRIKGIKRPGFAALIPNTEGCFMLMDSGANINCKPEMLLQFGIMGSIYMEKVMGIKNPRVGLANVGTEEHKGTELQHETFALLKKAPVNFIGNIEGRDVPLNGCDVLVADGFSGNLIIKTYEGVAIALMGKIKSIFTKNIKTKLAASLIMPEMKEFKKQFDYDEYGGAPIMGCAKPVFKAHGNSNAKTFKNAISLTKQYIENNVIEEISNSLQMMKDEK